MLGEDGENMKFIDPTENLILGEDTDVITSSQVITDDFLDDLEQQKEDFRFRLNGLTSVASIPESVVNKWLREGFDFWNAPAKDILRKMRVDEYQKFIISGNKTF